MAGKVQASSSDGKQTLLGGQFHPAFAGEVGLLPGAHQQSESVENLQARLHLGCRACVQGGGIAAMSMPLSTNIAMQLSPVCVKNRARGRVRRPGGSRSGFSLGLEYSHTKTMPVQVDGIVVSWHCRALAPAADMS